MALNVPGAAAEKVRAAMAVGDLTAARHAMEGVVALALDRVARAEAADEPGDIYNNGIALSEEALFGFQQEVGRDRISAASISCRRTSTRSSAAATTSRPCPSG